MYRRRSTEKASLPFKERPGHKSACAFCAVASGPRGDKSHEVIQAGEYSLVIANLFPYDVWEHMDVENHLLIIPKRHVTTMDELTPDERQEMMDLFCKYESAGYNLYARAPQSTARTIAHIHTHLIKHKPNVRPPKLFSLVWRKPQWLIKY